MKELDLKDIQKTNGGILPLIGAVVLVDCFLIGVMMGMQQEMAK